MRIILLLICTACTSSAPARPDAGAEPQFCNQFCNSNLECSTSISSQCKFCNFGSCSSVMPEFGSTMEGAAR